MGMDGLGSPGVVGKPNMPALTRFFALPVGADASVVLSGLVELRSRRHPSMAAADEAADPTAVEFSAPGVRDRSEDVRERTRLSGGPVGLGQVGTLRDLRLGGVETDGAQYNPVTRSLRVTRVSISTSPSAGTARRKLFADSRMTSLWNLGAQKTYESSLLNYAVARRTSTPLPVPVLRRGIPDRHAHALEPAAQTLATHRRADGISTTRRDPRHR